MTLSPLSNNMPRRFECLRYFPRTKTFVRGHAEVRVTWPSVRQMVVPLLFGGVFTREEISDLLWGHRLDGGPDYAQKSLDVMVNRARELFRPLEISFGTQPSTVYRAFDLRIEEHLGRDGRREAAIRRCARQRAAQEVAHAA